MIVYIRFAYGEPDPLFNKKEVLLLQYGMISTIRLSGGRCTLPRPKILEWRDTRRRGCIVESNTLKEGCANVIRTCAFQSLLKHGFRG